MSTLDVLGDFPQTAIAVAFGMGCALLMSFLLLKLILGLMTHEQPSPERNPAAHVLDPP
jgi:hypothetical protein